MIHNTKGIVLRAVKYGESSLICTIFTELFGVQSYMVQGVRSSKAKTQRAGLLQPATLLDLVVYRKPSANLQRIKEFQPAYLYTSLQQEVVKNTIALFSTELLLRLLPEQALMPELFHLSFDYFVELDTTPAANVANFPLLFIINCSSLLGYTLKGNYSKETPFLSLQEGGFTDKSPALSTNIEEADAAILSQLLSRNITAPDIVEMNAATRYRLLEWYIAFLHNHTQHMGNMRSLPVLQAILH